MEEVKLKIVDIQTPPECNCICGQAHFIKTVEDLYEALRESCASIEFGLAFNESSGECLVRCEGTHEELRQAAAAAALSVGAGHFFIIFLRKGYPINVLNRLKAISEVCGIYAASANPLQVIVAETSKGRGVLGVVDGSPPKGIEGSDGIKWRKEILRRLGYKL